ncbi:DUF4822 domain-containing protein [Microbacterium mangrovi]|uniref:DUF4822 domain-containing protein n=1 Tax=Microbacterium mangrovi TaxID=1348253 RepID=UPI0009DED8E3|nr:DUF4822 domain-containing protein [Microbacterium mangrovi]
MNFTSSVSRRAVIAASSLALAAVGVLPATAAFAAPASASASASVKAQTPSDVLASTPWKTTSAVDQNGDRVALDDPAVASFVGWAYFSADGTFTMYNLNDTPKMHGDWTVAPDGSSRWIAAKDAAGTVLFTRVVPIVELDKHTFTYRVFPNAADTGVFYDIVHTPTNHVEPGTGGNGPGAHGTPGGQGNGGYHFNNGNQH